MEFQLGDKLVQIRGDTSIEQEPISFHQLQALMGSDSVQEVYELYELRTETTSEMVSKESNQKKVLEPLKKLLNKFSNLFEAPKNLPPHRIFDHKIHLIP